MDYKEMDYKDLMGVGTNSRILDLYNQMKNKTLILQPDFQRRLVWNDEHKENFLDTIIKRFPFPEIYLADGELDIDTLTRKTLVVDGQQRLSTIYQYISGDEKLILKRIPKFAELNDKEGFLNYNVVVRDLKNITMDEIKEVFRRINSVSYALNAMEIDNALYDGEFIRTGQKIANNEWLQSLSIFTDTAVSRMKDVEFILLIMATCEVGTYFSNSKEVENYIQRYNNVYPHKELIQQKINVVLEYIESLKLEVDSLWLSKNALYTLICELLFWYDENKLLDTQTMHKLLEGIEVEVKKQAPEKEYAEFYLCLYQNTASKKARTIRGTLLREKMAKVK